MNYVLTRRQFFTRAAGAAAALALGGPSLRAASFRHRIHKAMIIGQVTEAALRPLKEAGFEGVETTYICPEIEAALGRAAGGKAGAAKRSVAEYEEDWRKGRAIADKLGMRVHSVLRGWMRFNSNNPKEVEDSLELTRLALRAAKTYGADDILLVPCRVVGLPMPEPWDFDIAFDAETGHVTRVAAGDNSPFKDYIEAQNHATDTSRAAVQKLIPLAEQLKVIIAIENVWNNLWVKPDLFKNFVASFQSPWARAYFDIGNHVKYAPPQEWIKVLGSLIVRLHVKDFRLNPDGHDGKFVHPREGSVNWPAVRQALEDVGFEGWASIEDSGLPLPEFNRRFDLILNGE
jgi:hexulose-6-phosphate isomerase